MATIPTKSTDIQGRTNEKEEDYGLIRPNLIKQLRSILDQYPDNGQILKELLQNAEDAGAKNVKFIYDEHSYATNHLYHPDMAQFQGAGLYAYNDALFVERDWMGIRMLQDSVKENDSMKIGRFGLGFKSVLHLTDLPSVLSAERLFMIDPHEKYFLFQGNRTSGYMWHTTDKRTDMKKIWNQFEPFEDMSKSLGESSLKSGFFNGTLFRFPLRQRASELCSTVYDNDRAIELFTQFESDAHLLLIFLKNIENLDLFVRRKQDVKPRLLFRVFIRSECIDEVRRCRKSFSESIKLNGRIGKDDVSVTYALQICTNKFLENGRMEEKVFRFLINEFCAGDTTSRTLKMLKEDATLLLLPLVGVAMEINGSDKSKEKLSDGTNSSPEKETVAIDDDCMNPKGQIFCFLPLPKEEKSASGLPVHVNGYFTISQNRRHIKWPSIGQKVESDKSLLWNRCLLREILPLSYRDLLLNATRSKEIESIDVYSAVPNLIAVDEKWQILLEPFFRLFFDLAIFYTRSHDDDDGGGGGGRGRGGGGRGGGRGGGGRGEGGGRGRWIRVDECIFDCMKEEPETRSLIVEILICGRVPIVEVKPHLLHALGAFSDHSPEIITPSLVRLIVKTSPQLYMTRERTQKLTLLKYLLKDEVFNEMEDIDLLPLADDTFIRFKKSASQTIYVPTLEFPATLLSNLKGILLADDFDDLLKHKFNKLVQSVESQVRFLTSESVASLIPKVIPKSWFNESIVIYDINDIESHGLHVDWLPMLWSYLRTHHPSNLQKFNGLPILPITNTSPLQLVRLSETSSAIARSALGTSLSLEIEKMLIAIGANVVVDLPQYVRDHAAVLGIYVKVPLTEDVIEVVYNACRVKGHAKTLKIFRDDLTETDKSEFLELIGRIQPKSIDSKYIKFLRFLPFFRCTSSASNDEPEFVSVEEVKRAAPAKKFSLMTGVRFLDVSSEIARKAALILGASFINVTTMIKEILSTEFKTGFSDIAKAEAFADDIFSNLSTYSDEDPTIVVTLSSVAFVMTTKGRLECPRNLFDPDDSDLQSILAGADVFPSNKFAETENVRHLRKMGLKSVKDLSSEDLLSSMRQIEKTQDTENPARDSSIALLNFFNRNPDLLLMETGNGKLLVECVSEVSWVAASKEKPSIFPSSMELFREKEFYPPRFLKSIEWLPVIGAVRPVVAVECVSKVNQLFGWDLTPDLKSMIEQLSFVIASCNLREKAQVLTVVMTIYEFLSKYEPNEISDALKECSLVTWIWQGDGFASTSDVVINPCVLNIRPYRFNLPSEMQSYSIFFQRCGVSSALTMKMLMEVLYEMKKKHEDGSGGDDDCERDTQLAVSILNQIAKDGTNTEHGGSQELLVLCKTEDDKNKIKLIPISECTYCDVDWLRKDFNLLDFDENDGIVFIHPQLPTSTAASLGVPTLMSRMLNAEELDITSFGQSEPLTSRLKKLLEDYSDGLSIPKELIQNADDAGATEVKFLYDERRNEDAMKFLIDDKMKACQGPALWAYNNAMFTDRDFDNITRLGGATKMKELDKIGKFGLGFNAVYNVTDVPSFMTRNTIVIFDPHTSHLGRGIKDRSKPGIKIDLSKNRTLLRKLPDQFKPYENVFGCHIKDNDETFYDGTLFRFPLRTKEEAARSEISNLYYDRDQVVSLLTLLIQSAPSLLLFTQTVHKISFYHLPSDGNLLEPREVLSLEKSLVSVARQLTHVGGDWIKKLPDSCSDADKQLVSNCSMLRASREYMVGAKAASKRKPNMMVAPRSSLLLKMAVSLSDAGHDLTLRPPAITETFWFVSSAFGQKSSLEMAVKSDEGFVPAAGVACLVECQDGGYVPKSLREDIVKGRAFCYLPLPVPTGLPLHINAFFALHSDRRRLSFATDDDKTNVKVEWNQMLLADAVCAAYVQLLKDITFVLPANFDLGLYDIWPSLDAADSYFIPLVESFFKSAATISENVPMLYSRGKAVAFDDLVLLENSMAGSQLFQIVAAEILSNGSQNKKVGVMPDVVLRTFADLHIEKFIEVKIFSIERFFGEVFLSNVASISAQTRDSLVLFALLQNNPNIDKLVKEHSCIPVSPDGSILRKPQELIHPSSPAACLFLPEDGRFPHGESFSGQQSALSALQRLGMQTTSVSWMDLIDRCQNQTLICESNAEKGKNRLDIIVMFIDRMLLRDRKSLSDDSDVDLEWVQETLREVPFLIPLPKPVDFPLRWMGNEVACQLIRSSETFTCEKCYLVSATSCVIDDKRMSFRVRDFLGLTTRKVSLEQVITQMEHALDVNVATLSSKEYDQLQNCIHAIYTFLEERCALDEEIASQLHLILKDRPCILMDGAYLSTNQVAINFPYTCAPYLYGLPTDFVKKYHVLLKSIGVRGEFEVKDYMSVLQFLKKKNCENPLNSNDLDLSIRMVTQLNNSIKMKQMAPADVESEHGLIFVPNTRGILQPAKKLCYNDCPWITQTASMNFTHPEITFRTSACLGVRTKCQEALSRHARGIPFGQKERLTNSLKRILHSYPFDHEILKELIQNADDAGATTIHFIIDGRFHPTEHVFDKQWRPLQGPALSVYNNSPFTENDLRGIQQLGEGSKSFDFSKTGQYGIGFSSVYHLTDAPSLLTTASDGKKTLCVFDPHCRYVPGATPSEPGMQFDNVDDLREAFPDIFHGYLEDEFSVKGSTVFRLPLRTAEMAENSDISKTPVTVSKVRGILDQLKEVVFEILLFTSHLEELSISEVDAGSGQLVNNYTIKALQSKEDRKSRYRIADAVQKASMQLESQTKSLHEIDLEEATCTTVLTDNSGNQEKWFVSHQVGFDGLDDLPDDVGVAFVNGDLALLPRGGVACLMERRCHARIDSSSTRPSRVFCFLPLPIETQLPVHINGHFALGYENRRHLWTNSESPGYKRQWNDLLCSKVIAPAYAKLLKGLRMLGLNGSFKDNVGQVDCSRLILDAALKAFMAFFPAFNETRQQWTVLTRSTYEYIGENDVAILPSVCESDLLRSVEKPGSSDMTNEIQRWQITWLPPCGDGENKAFFNRKEKSTNDNDKKVQASFLGKVRSWFGKSRMTKEKSNEEILKDVLLDCGLKLVDATDDIFDNFRRSGVDVEFMTPDSVVDFFSSYSVKRPMCSIGDLPQPLTNTPFQNEKTLLLVINFCKTSTKFKEQLPNLPFLLTADDILRTFSSDERIFFSKFCDLFSTSSDRFLKPTLLETAFEKELLPETEVFHEFRIIDLVEMLPQKLPEETFTASVGKVAWPKSFNSIPTERWIQRLWTYLSSQLEDILKDAVSSPEEKNLLVSKELMPLKEWCIVPALVPSGFCLFSVGAAGGVVDFGNREYQNIGMRSVVKKLRFPQLDIQAINTDYCNNLDIVSNLVTTFDKPDKVLDLLHKHFTNPELEKSCLSKEDCDQVLKFLVNNIEFVKRDDETSAEKIRNLPIFKTIFGDFIRLTGCLVYTLPAKIPTNGVDIWQSKSGTVFLERNDSVQSIYDFLGCAAISIIDVYCQFIFQHFEYFPLEDRLVHLYHIYTRYMQSSTTDSDDITEEERKGLVSSLRNLAFLEDEEGELQCANHFYDPENVVFRIMLPTGRFAPKANRMFKESEWYSFLAMLGMVKEVTRPMFLEFTQAVAKEGQDPKSASALMKSKVLVQHLYRLSNVIRDPILDEIIDVPFVAPEPASSALLEIYPQRGDLGNAKLAYIPFRKAISRSHEKLCWTCANLLPSWADPMHQTTLMTPEQEEIIQRLQIQKIPDTNMIINHLEMLCENFNYALPVTPNIRATKLEVYRSIYKHLVDHMDDLSEVQDKLEKIPCVVVDDSKACVLTRQTVINIYDADELRPYLYKLPVELGEFQRLFLSIGATNRATPTQFIDVLERLKMDVGDGRMTPNELRTAYKCVRGLLEALEKSPTTTSDIPTCVLYLPSESGMLVEATRLVFNDAPSFYDRVKEYNLQFLFDLRECGLRSKDIDEFVNLLPLRMKPAMLNAYVQETLVESSRRTISSKGRAKFLSERLRSQHFLHAVVRIARHEANKNGRKLDEQTMFSVLDRLSTINVYTVPRIVTHLSFKGKPVAGSDVEKVCFVERLPGATTELHVWNIYMQDDKDISQELLIPLAEVVNKILSGILHDSVLYLLPVLTCPEDEIQKKLDQLNIRFDHSTQAVVRAPTMPPAGSPVDDVVKLLCCWGQMEFQPGEYVAYRDSSEKSLVYGIIREELMSPNDERVYLIDLGSSQDGIISTSSKLCKFSRK